jgi:pimeloyl-ACP methyl ester carboxylesterase
MPYADNNGIKIFYDTYGTGTPIVFLHPWTTNGYIWYYQIFPFARTNHCIAVDHRGHGRSDKPKTGYSIQEHASDVRAVFDAAKIDKAVLVGNSIGGMIQLQFTLDYPDRVLGNVVVSSGTALSSTMPAGALDAFKKDYAGTFGALLEGTVSAKEQTRAARNLRSDEVAFHGRVEFPEVCLRLRDRRSQRSLQLGYQEQAFEHPQADRNLRR